MLETRAKEIAGITYRVTQLGFSKGRATFVRLMKTAGPVIARLLEGGDGPSIGGVGTRALAGALQELAERLTDEDLDYFFATFGEQTTFDVGDGKQPGLTKERRELLFAGKYEQAFEWLAFALEVNYAGFFESVRRLQGGGQHAEIQATKAVVAAAG